MVRTAVALGVAAVLMAAVPATASAVSADSVSVVNGVLTFRAGAGLANAVTVDRFPINGGVVYRVSEGGTLSGRSPLDVVAGPGCMSPSQSIAYCDLIGTRRIVMLLGDRNDDGVVADFVRIPATIQGGPGNDRLAGGAGPDVLIDSSGFDQFQGHAGNDRIYTRDRRHDPLVDCSSGLDRVVADAIDSPFPGCETVVAPR